MSKLKMQVAAGLRRIRTKLEGSRDHRVQLDDSGVAWAGADVVVSCKKLKRRRGGFWPEPRVVVSANADQMGWLFGQITKVCMPLLDGCTKIEFYGRLAHAALHHQAGLRGHPESTKDVLLAVLDEAQVMVKEIGAGTFRFLTLAPGGVIADDLEKNP